MPMTTRATARRAGSFFAVFGVLLAMVLTAGPAQAAPVVTITASADTITLGESVTLTWTSSDTVDLDAGGDWAGAKAVPNGSEVVTPASGPGIYVYELTASNNSGDEDGFDSISIQVLPGPITANPVEFPDDCTVIIPATPNVTYFVDYGDDDIEEVDAGTYDGSDFSAPGFPVTFFAVADDGFSLNDEAATEWDYTASESCFPTLVNATATCGKVTFENILDENVTVLYGGEDEDEEDGELQIAGGASKTISTNRDQLLFIAFTDDDEDGQFDIVDVPQDCDDGDNGDGDGDGSDHPTVAPAAGVAAR